MLSELEETDDATLSTVANSVVATYSDAASKALISFYNSLILDWQGHALEADEGIFWTGAGIEMQFPFPSLRYPIAHVNGTLAGMHPPAPSVTNPSWQEATGSANGVYGEA